MELGADRVDELRGGHVENSHALAWCLVDRRGVLSASGADAPGLPVFARSATKPFQAIPAVRAGLLDELGLDARHLAIACASHGGGPAHLAAVRAVLATAGLEEDALACGPLAPRDPALAGRAPASRLANNCSGKHALALALCRVRGLAPEGYERAGHPVQELMRSAVAQAAGEPVDAGGVDGCGMQTFRLTLAGLAHAFGRLASGALGPAGARVRDAVTAHPGLVGHAGSVDTELMAAEHGVVAKIGAAGVLGMGLPDGRAIALKVLDGANTARDAAAVALAREVLGLRAAGTRLETLIAPAVRNTSGDEVGRVVVAPIRARARLTAVS